MVAVEMGISVRAGILSALVAEWIDAVVSFSTSLTLAHGCPLSGGLDRCR